MTAQKMAGLLLAGFVYATAGISPAQAQELKNINPNALGETLTRMVEGQNGAPGRLNPYVTAKSTSLICRGGMPMDKSIQIYDEKERPRILGNFDTKLASVLAKDQSDKANEVSKIAQDPKTTYIEFSGTVMPTTAEFSKFFQTQGIKTDYIGMYGTGLRNGSSVVTILLPTTELDKFLVKNKDAILKTAGTMQQALKDDPNYSKRWTKCGPSATR